FPWYQRAASQDDNHALYMMGRYYALGFSPVAKDPDQALPYFERAARAGWAAAGVEAARLYMRDRHASAASPSGGGVTTPFLEAERKDKALYWLEYGMPKLSVR